MNPGPLSGANPSRSGRSSSRSVSSEPSPDASCSRSASRGRGSPAGSQPGGCIPATPGSTRSGDAGLGTEGELAAALLFAGPGSALGGISALWWLGLLNRRPSPTRIDAPGQRRPQEGLRLRRVARPRRSDHRGLPVVPLPRALLHATEDLGHDSLRLVLARAEFRHKPRPPDADRLPRSGPRRQQRPPRRPRRPPPAARPLRERLRARLRPPLRALRAAPPGAEPAHRPLPARHALARGAPDRRARRRGTPTRASRSSPADRDAAGRARGAWATS